MSTAKAKDPGYQHTRTKHISFSFYTQSVLPAPFDYEYFVSLPPSYSSASGAGKSALILFLHGAGESQRANNESYASVCHGIPKIVLGYDKMRDGVSPPSIDVPLAPRLRMGKGSDRSVESVDEEVCRLCVESFITVTPSLNLGSYKVVEREAGHKLSDLRKNYFGYGWNSSVLSALLDEIVETYNVDVDRIHVTGFSMGGYGTWDIAMHSPNRFASLMPICGGGDTLRAKSISHIPHWIHHGGKDDIIPLKQSQAMVTALQKAGASISMIQFTRYPGLKHDSWTDAYSNPEVYKWMLAQKRANGDEMLVPEDNLASVS